MTRVSTVTTALALLLLVLCAASPARGQVNGHVSLIVDALPDVGGSGGPQAVTELRARIFAERDDSLGDHVRLKIGAFVDALAADREATGGRGTSLDARVRPADLYVDVVTRSFELRAGAARLVWGRLDEFQPTDVVNPIDLSKFLMEGRSEARLPVGLVRVRAFLPKSTTVEGVVVPHFRGGRFDQLEEESSPFNLFQSTLPTVRDEPGFGAGALQGGARLTSTTARVDWGVSVYRGLRAFPTLTLTPAGVVRESFPRFTMIGADFESVKGLWGIRGEIAAFVDDELQSTRVARGVPGKTVNGGIGVDRRAGDYRVAGNILWSWSGIDRSDPAAAPFAGDEELERTDLSLVAAVDRSFARETRTLRLFTVYDPADATAFVRVIGAVSVRDNWWVEGSAGVFTGESFDVIGRLSRRDFLYARLKVFF